MKYTKTINKTKICSFILFFISLLTLLTLSVGFGNVHAASFTVSGGGNVNTGQNITVTILANHPQAYNAITVNVNFSNLSYINSTVIGNWSKISGPTRSGNTVTFTGALLGSSATGTREVLSITFKAPNSPGSASISCSGTIALADGSGTQISAGGNTVTYNIKTPPPPPSPTPTPKPAPGPVNVSSSTHPDQNQWYKVRDVTFNWNQETGVTDFSYVFDNQPSTNPDDISEGDQTTKTYSNLGDGTYYFHIKSKNETGWGPVSHFTVNIDTSSPDPFTPTLIRNPDNSYKLFFATNDLSSTELTYFLKVDGIDLGETKSGVNIPAGTKSLVITAFDKAGNAQTSEFNFGQQQEVASASTEDNTNRAQSNKTNNKTNNDSLSNSLPFIIALILILIYAFTITIMYLSEKGVFFKRNSKESKINIVENSMLKNSLQGGNTPL